jgi:hypothetical protein
MEYLIYLVLFVFGISVIKQIIRMINPLNWGVFSFIYTPALIGSYIFLLYVFDII